jgi:hypothetical protein
VLSAIDASITNIGIIKLADLSRHTTCAQEVVVMESQEHTVTSGVNIGFEIRVSKFDCSSEGGHGVFWCVTRTTSMRESNRKLSV